MKRRTEIDLHLDEIDVHLAAIRDLLKGRDEGGAQTQDGDPPPTDPPSGDPNGP